MWIIDFIVLVLGKIAGTILNHIVKPLLPDERKWYHWIFLLVAFVVIAYVILVLGKIDIEQPRDLLQCLPEVLSIQEAGPAAIDSDNLNKLERLSVINSSGDVFAIGATDVPGTQRVAIGSDTDIQIWDFGPTPNYVCTLPKREEYLYPEEITSLDFSTGGDWLVSGSQSGSVKLWNVSDCEFESQYIEYRARGSSPVFKVALQEDEELLVFSYDSSDIYDLSDRPSQTPRKIDFVSSPPVIVSPNGVLLWSTNEVGWAFSLFDLATEEWSGGVGNSSSGWLYWSMAFSNNSENVALARTDFLEVMSVHQIMEAQDFRSERLWIQRFPSDLTTELAFDPKDRLLAALTPNQLFVYSAEDGTLEYYSEYSDSQGGKWLSFTADGAYLVLAAEHRVEIWGVRNPCDEIMK